MPRKARPLPSLAYLKDAAVRYLARYNATEAGVGAVLTRKIAAWADWARQQQDADAARIDAIAAQARDHSAAIIRQLTQQGVINDADFAQTRAAGLRRAGRSRRAAAAYLGAKGVSGALIAQTLPQDEAAEWQAALIFARKRRLGPFAAVPPAPDMRMKQFAKLARAGFSAAIASKLLRLDPDEAASLLVSR